jgi:flagellar motor switch/type III secretory pathway protein FliN
MPPPSPADRQHAAPTTALVPVEPEAGADSALKANGPLSRLPVELDVGVPIRNFRVRNLLALEPGVVVASQWPHGDDLPVMSGHQALAWSEFEVIDTHLAVRLTRLS